MRDGFVLYSVPVTGKDGSAAVVPAGLNPMLVTHFEATADGGALLHLMSAKMLSLTPAQWSVVSKQFVGGETEPAAAKP